MSLNKCLVGLILSLAAVAAPAAAAERWIVMGGEGRASAIDLASVKKNPDGSLSLDHAFYSAAPMAAPEVLGGGVYHGLIGELTVDCKARLAKLGAATFFFPDGLNRELSAPPNLQFSPVTASDSRLLFLEAACTGRRPVDVYAAADRAKALERLRRLARQPRVTSQSKAGWVVALGDASRLVAIDTSSSRRAGDIVTQTELTWMVRPQTTNGQTWRYNQITVEYDCAKGRRRGAGPMQIFAPDDKLVHEEVVKDAPWAALPPNGPPAMLLEMACKNRKLEGLPSGARGAVLARLKEITALL